MQSYSMSRTYSSSVFGMAVICRSPSTGDKKEVERCVKEGPPPQAGRRCWEAALWLLKFVSMCFTGQSYVNIKDILLDSKLRHIQVIPQQMGQDGIGLSFKNWIGQIVQIF